METCIENIIRLIMEKQREREDVEDLDQRGPRKKKKNLDKFELDILRTRPRFVKNYKE